MNKTKKEILEKIKTNKIKMRPKWKFEAENIGFKTLALVIILGSALGLAMVGVFVAMYNPVELSGYGEIGWDLIKADFPYLWLISTIVLGITGWLIEKNLGDNYKRGWIFWAGVTAVAIIIMAAIILGLYLIGQ